MSQKNLILVGLGILIILLGVWVYLMFFAPDHKANDIFTDLGQSGEIDNSLVIEPVASSSEPVVNMDRPRLRQLTTRPIIGFTEVQATSSDPIAIYYAEAGTGHIYKINLTSGEEIRVSNSTIGEASVASFSKDGAAVAIRANNNLRANDLNISLVKNEPSEFEKVVLEKKVYDFTLVSSTTLLYTTKEPTGMVVYSRNWQTGTEKVLFTIPFFEANIAWGKTENDPQIVYPKPSYLLEGYLYQFSKGKVERLPAAGFGLTAINTPNYIVYSITKDSKPVSLIYNRKTKEKMEAQYILLPEKCVNDTKEPNYLWCAVQWDKPVNFDFPDNWYRGNISFSDILVKIDLREYGSEYLVDILKESKREVDVTSMSIGDSETALYFINKNDNTLWMYEL